MLPVNNRKAILIIEKKATGTAKDNIDLCHGRGLYNIPEIINKAGI